MDEHTIKTLKVSCLVVALFAVLGIAPIFVVGGAWMFVLVAFALFLLVWIVVNSAIR